MDLGGRKLSDTYRYLLSAGPTPADQTITLGDGSVVSWQSNGIVVTGNVAQTINGSKTFLQNLTIPQTLNFTNHGQFVKDGNHKVTLKTSSESAITFSSTNALTYTIPNLSTNASFVMTEGAQIINGNKTFNNDVKIYGDTEIGLTGTATNLFGTGASSNQFGNSVINSNTFGNDVTGGSSVNSFGNRSRLNYFGTGATTNHFGASASGSNNFGNSLSGSSIENNFGNNLISGARNNFGKNSKNYFGENGENYFYSGSFAGPVTMPSTVSYTNAGQIVKSGAHSLGLATTAGTTGIFPTGNINIAALEGTQTFAGEKTFSSGINITKTSDQLVLGNTTKLTISSTAPASNRKYTIPDAGKDVNFILSSGTQTIEGVTTFTSTINANITGNAGSTTNAVYTSGDQIINGVKTFSSRPTINGTGVLMSGDSLIGTTTQYSIAFGYGISGANFTWNGNQDKIVNINTAQVAVLTGDQTIGGVKTFTNGQIIQSAVDQLTLRTGSAGSTIKISAPNILGDRVYTIPDVGGNASFVMTTGNQTISGQKTLTNTLSLIGSSNQLIFRTGIGGNITTISSSNVSGDRIYTIPEVSGDASFVMTTGNQTIGGVKNFTSRPTISGLNVLIQGDTSIFTRVEAPNLLYNTGDQNISGIKSFIGNGTNQLSLRTGISGSFINISAPIITGDRVYTIPDVGGNASFLMNSGNQAMQGPLLAPNLVYNTGEQIISGRKRFRNASVVPYGPFINDVDADFNGLLSSREVYFTDDGSVKSAIDIPSLDIVYETGSTTLTPRIGPTPTLSRTQTNTSGTYLASDGYIKYAASNQPRFDHAISKNLFHGSDSFINFWRYPEYNPGFTELMIQQNADINPFKSAKNAEKFIDVTGSGVAASYIIRRDATLRSGLNYTMSVFAKPINNNFIILTLAGGVRAFYNLSNGSVSGMGGGTIISSGIDSSYGNGWSRLWLSIAHNTATASYINSITSSNSAAAFNKTVTTASDAFYLWGPQLEENSIATPYEIAYGSWSDPYKNYRAPKGLLIEKNSTNLVLFSNNFTGGSIGNYSLNGGISLTGGAWPDGSGVGVSGSIYTEDNTISEHTIYRHPITSVTAGTNYVSSIFLKQPISGSTTGRRYVVGRISGDSTIADTRVCIDLDPGLSGGLTIPISGYATPSFYTGIRYPNNWYRLIIGQRATGSASSGINCQFSSTTGFGSDIGSYQGLNGPAIQIFGHQIETVTSGDSATSYKPTSGTSGSLGRDIVSLGSFANFYNQAEGTFFIEAELLQNNSSQTIGMFGIEGGNRPSGSYSLSRNQGKFEIGFSSAPPQWTTAAQFSKTTGSNNISVIASYKENSFKTSFYNEAIQIDTSGKIGSIPMDRIIFGANGETAGPQYSHMYLQRFSYWPLQLQNTKLTGIYRY